MWSRLADIVSAGQKQNGDAEKEGRSNEWKGIHERVKHNVALCCCLWIIDAFEFDYIAAARKILKYLEEKRNVQNKYSGEVLWEHTVKYTEFSVFWGVFCFLSFIGMECRPDTQKLCSHLVVNICKKFSLAINFNSISIIYKGNFFFSLLPGQNFVKRFTHHWSGNYCEC